MAASLLAPVPMGPPVRTVQSVAMVRTKWVKKLARKSCYQRLYSSASIYCCLLPCDWRTSSPICHHQRRCVSSIIIIIIILPRASDSGCAPSMEKGKVLLFDANFASGCTINRRTVGAGMTNELPACSFERGILGKLGNLAAVSQV